MALKRFTVGSYFSGGGIGLARIKDRVDIAFGVEYDPAISEVYRANISDRIITARVQDVDVKKLDRVDLFQVSPVCKEFSNAKVNGQESAEEMGQAAAICAYLDYHKPPFFVLENVRGYIKSKSFSMVVVKLSRLGYQMRYSVENSANFGVPQTRERLILRASLNGSVPVLSGYVSRWVGWYEAIEDLIPTLPESKFSDWQLARLPQHHLDCLLVGNQGDMPYTPKATLPAMTVLSSIGGRMRAFIVGGQNMNSERGKGYREEIEPSFTIPSSGNGVPRAFIVGQDSKATTREGKERLFTLTAEPNREYIRAWLSQGRVVQMTPRALARFQSIPDWYELPQKNGLACTVIGNGIPSLMGEKIIASTLGLNEVKTELIA